jgi:ABC-type branched-subunit amino acid transport system permease subunit
VKIMQQRAEYEFTGEQSETIKTLAFRMRWVGIFLIAIGVLAGIAGLMSLGEAGIAVVSIIQAAIYALIGLWTIRAAASFAKIPATEGQDISNLMNALGSLRSLYNFQFWLIIAGLVVLVLSLLARLFAEPAPAPA